MRESRVGHHVGCSASVGPLRAYASVLADHPTNVNEGHCPRRPSVLRWARDGPGRGSPCRRGRAARGPEAMRWGLGPVFIYECLANSRRWQTYAIRSAGVALLLAAIATIAMPHMTF